MTYQDPSQNFIYEYPHALESIFSPRQVAVIGARDTMGSVGRTIMANLLSGGFQGKVVGVNPKRSEVMGAPCYPSIKDVPGDVDLAVIVIPALHVLQAIRECVEKKVKSAIIISAGFKELGPEGLRLENEVINEAKRGGIRVIGPNCLGVMNPHSGLNASFARGIALKGSLAFISQSGAMCTAVLDWSLKQGIGFSGFVSIGSMADVNWGDLIEYYGRDPHTKAILIYMETVGNPRQFMSAAREVALDKPIIIIKPGKSNEARKAAASHTGSLSGSDDVFEAACERAGVLRVESISQLFAMAEVLARQPKPRGPNLAIVTNAGGPSVLATDSAIEHGAKIASLDPKTIEVLNTFLPSAWSHGNPVDILGDADPTRYEKTIQELMKDEAVHGLLVVLSPQDMTDAEGTSKALSSFSHNSAKPIITSWMGGASVEKGREILTQQNIPCFQYPDDAAWSFAMMWRDSQLIDALYRTPSSDISRIEEREKIKNHAKDLIHTVREAKRELLTEDESKRLLSLYGIPVVETVKASSIEEAKEAAKRMGFPVVVKLHSETITHKSDVGGVQLNIRSLDAVEAAFNVIRSNVETKYGLSHFQGVTVQKMVDRSGVELIIGSSLDPQFGPVILFGAGGIYVEVMKDRALGLPPLNSTHALRMMHKTKIINALSDFRGKKAVPLEKVADCIVKFSELIVDHPEIIESDMNPLIASSEGIIALDARFVLAPEKEIGKLPQPACRPYPIEYVRREIIKDNEQILLRPMRAEDEPLIIEFHKELSERSVRQRFFEFVSFDARVSHERLVRICNTDFDREIALVAEVTDSQDETMKRIGGVVRLVKEPGILKWNLKLIVIDRYQGKGLGKALMKHAFDVIQKEGVSGEILAYVLEENGGMITILKRYGFELKSQKADSILEFSKIV